MQEHREVGVKNAWSVLRASVRKVPQLRWAYGVIGIIAAAAIVRGLGVAPNDLLVVILPFLAVMLLFFIFSKVAGGVLGAILSWAVVLLVVLTAIGVATCVFFDVPKPITVLAEQIRNAFSGVASIESPQGANVRRSDPVESTFTVSGELPFDQLPERFTIAVAEGSQKTEIAGELIVDGGVIYLPATASSSTPRNLVADKLVLKNGGRIQTNGAALNLAIRNLVSSGGALVAFPPAGAQLQPPHNGGTAKEGRSANTVRLVVLGRLEGRLRVDLGGEAGGPGAPGNNGRPGPPGRNGDNARSGFGCDSGAGDGGPGENGKDGLNGLPGGEGGNGGNLILIADQAVASGIEYSGTGGAPGAGGVGGKGGSGGPGGKGGNELLPLCRGNGKSGAAGAAGLDGIAGPAGSGGRPGSLELRPMQPRK